MKDFTFDFPINEAAKPIGMLTVEAYHHKGSVQITTIRYTEDPREYAKTDVTGLIEQWSNSLWQTLQEAAEHQAIDLGLAVYQVVDPKETELSEILKP